MESSFIQKVNLKLTKVKLTDKLFFTKNLSLMVKSGIPIVRSLNSLYDQTENLKLKHILKSMHSIVEKGDPLSKALSMHRDVFSEVFINMVKAGEESGSLENVLNTLTLQMEKEHDLKSKVRGALAYPVVVLVAMVSIVTGLIVFVIPKLTKMFVESGMKLPLPTRILISVSNFTAKYFYLIILFLIFLVFAFIKFKQTSWGKRILHKVILNSPILGKLAKKFNTARITRLLSSLLKTDMHVVDSFLMTSKILKNVYYRDALKEVSDKLKTGSSINSALSKHKDIFPSVVIQMVAVGEETGTLDNMLEEIAKFYEDDLDNTLKNLPSLLEPILILILGVTVGGIAISIMMPIFTLTQGVGGAN